MHGRVVRIVVGLLLAAAAGSACGGGLSREEFIQEADQRCKQANQRFQKLQSPTSREKVRQVGSTGRTIINDLIADLRDLEPPEEGRELIDKMLKNLEDASDYLVAMTDAASQGDRDAIQNQGAKLIGAVGNYNKAAKDYGLKTCSSGPVSLFAS